VKINFLIFAYSVRPAPAREVYFRLIKKPPYYRVDSVCRAAIVRCSTIHHRYIAHTHRAANRQAAGRPVGQMGPHNVGQAGRAPRLSARFRATLSRSGWQIGALVCRLCRDVPGTITGQSPRARSDQNPGILGRISMRWSLGRAIAGCSGRSLTSSWGSCVL
jgi:hypothetical protein